MKNRSGGILWGIVLIVLGVIFIGNISGLWDFSLFFCGLVDAVYSGALPDWADPAWA